MGLSIRGSPGINQIHLHPTTWKETSPCSVNSRADRYCYYGPRAFDPHLFSLTSRFLTLGPTL